MLIKYIDGESIWTLGYPFIFQFLIVFNMEDNHVGIKTLKKTALPIINCYDEWIKWNSQHDNSYLAYKIIGIIILAIFAIIFLIYRARRRKSANSNTSAFVTENNVNNNVNNNKNDIVY